MLLQPLTTNLGVFTGYVGQLPPDHRGAILDLLATPYLAMSYPTPAEFGAACGADPGTAAFAVAWEAAIQQARRSLDGSYRDCDGLCAIFTAAHTGEPRAVATMQIVFGEGRRLIAGTIGDFHASSLPTHKMYRGFSYPCLPGLNPEELVERRVIEMGRLAVARPEVLRPLVAAGRLTPAEQTYVTRRGRDLLIALAWRFACARLELPRLAIFNTRPRLADALLRHSWPVRPLFLGGVEPTPELLASGKLVGSYFQRWYTVLGPLVPASVIRQGLLVAIQHLAAGGFSSWHDLPISLPYCFDPGEMQAAVDRLAERCMPPEAEALASAA